MSLYHEISRAECIYIHFYLFTDIGWLLLCDPLEVKDRDQDGMTFAFMEFNTEQKRQ